jgi:hypothetical protein
MDFSKPVKLRNYSEEERSLIKMGCILNFLRNRYPKWIIGIESISKRSIALEFTFPKSCGFEYQWARYRYNTIDDTVYCIGRKKATKTNFKQHIEYNDELYQKDNS